MENEIKGKEADMENDKYKNIIEASVDGFWVNDLKGHFIEVNDAYCKMSGYSREELLTMKISDIEAEESDEEVREHTRNIIKNGADRFETKHRRKDGKIIEVEISVGFDRESDRLISFGHDITERKLSQERVSESENKYKYLVENIQEGIWMLDANGVTTYTNQKMAELLGYNEPADMLGKHLFLFVNKNNLELAKQNMERLKKGQTERFDFEFLRKDSSTVYTNIQAAPLNDERGVYIGALAFVTDITLRHINESEHKAITEALQKSETRYRRLFEAAKDGVLILDADTAQINDVNTFLIDLLGYSKEEFLGKKLLDISPFKDLQQIREGFKKLSIESYIRYDGLPLQTKRGDLIEVEFVSNVYEVSGKKVIQCNIRDVTQKKIIEREIKKNAEEIEGLYNNAPCGYHSIDKDGTIVRMNNTELEWFGYAWQEVIGKKKLYDMLTPAGREKFKKNFPFLKEKGYLKDIEADFISKDGSVKTMLVNSYAINDSSGNYIMNRSILVDITGLKLTDGLLKKSEETLKAIYSSMNEGMALHKIIYDKKGKPADYEILQINPSFERILNINGENAIGKKASIVYGTGTPPYLDIYARVAESGKPEKFETYFEPMQKALTISVFSPEKGRFATIFEDITERKRSEELLKESEEKYRTLTENTIDIIYTLDDEGIFTFVNSRVSNYGFNQKDIIGHNFLEFVHPEDKDRVAEDFKEIMRTGREYITRFRVGSPKGETVWVEENSRLLRNSRGKNIGIIGVLRDITERRKAEDLLQKSEERFKTITENIPGVVYQFYFRKNGEMGVYFASERYKDILGLSGDLKDLFAKFIECFEPEEKKRLLESIRKAAETASPWQFEGWFNKPTGGKLFLRGSSAPVSGQNEIIFNGMLFDVSDRKKMEDALKESEEKYKNVIENANEAILVAQDLSIKYLNPKIQEMTGFSAEEIFSKQFLDFIHEEDRKQALNHYNRILSGEKGVGTEQFRIIRKDKKEIWVKNNAIQIQWQGKPATLNFLTDITEEKLSQELLRQSEEKYRLVVENADELIIIIQDGMLKYFNSKTVYFFGYSDKDLSTKPMLDFIYPEDRKIVAENHTKRLKGEESGSNYPARIVSKKGDVIWMEIKGIRIEWQGRPAVLAFLTDISKRKQAEDEVRNALSEVEDLYNNAPCGYHSIDENSYFLRINNTELSWLGYSREELVGRKKFTDIITPEGVEFFKKTFPAYLKSGIVSNYDFDLIRKDGSVLPIVLNSTAIKDSSGKFLMTRSTIFDNTEKKRMENILKESEEKYRLFVENANESVVVVQDGFFKYLNPRILELMGYSKEEAVSKPFLDFVIEEDKKLVFDNYIKRIKGEEKRGSYALRVISKDNRVIWFQNNTVLIQWEGKPATLNFLTDITDLKNFEEELNQSEERLRGAFETSNIGMAFTSPDDRYLRVNKAFCNILGYSEQEMLSKTINDITYPEDLQSTAENNRRLLSGEINFFNLEKRYVHKTGKIVWVNLSVSLVRDKKGNPLYLFPLIEDITAAKNAQEELNKRLIDLERFQKVTVDRELRMKELKQKIAELEDKLQKY